MLKIHKILHFLQIHSAFLSLMSAVSAATAGVFVSLMTIGKFGDKGSNFKWQFWCKQI